MNHLIPHMQTLLPGFNERAFTEIDFYRIVTAEDIYTDFWPLPNGVNGFYGVNRRHRTEARCIIINERDHPRGPWLQTAFHELVHHFLHVPTTTFEVFFSHNSDDITGRADREADMLALMMRIPLPRLHELMQPGCDEILNYWADDLRSRLAIYETYGV